eukprot:265855-Prymnesium_polylepis.1
MAPAAARTQRLPVSRVCTPYIHTTELGGPSTPTASAFTCGRRRAWCAQSCASPRLVCTRPCTCPAACRRAASAGRARSRPCLASAAAVWASR